MYVLLDTQTGILLILANTAVAAETVTVLTLS